VWNGTVTLDGGDRSNGIGIDTNLNSYITIDGLNISNYNMPIRITNPFGIVYGITVKNSQISRSNNDGIYAYTGGESNFYDLVIENNSFNDVYSTDNYCQYGGAIWLLGVNSSVIRNNLINNSGGGICGNYFSYTTIENNHHF